jgi:23S rRNA (cytosine1962-C5)-methyltransferase
MSLILNHKFQGLYNRLQKQYKLLKKQADEKGITCFRLYDKDMPEHPLIIDVYENNFVVYEYESRHQLTDDQYELWQETCIAILLEVTQSKDEHIFLKTRRRKKDRNSQYQKLNETKQFEIVTEGGLQFYTNYNDFLDTGLFLDHRPTRQMVQLNSQNKKVLNLFCYTGSFSFYAAAGGAKEVWSIDMSNTYIDWCKNNATLNKNKCANTNFKWIKADVLQYIKDLPKHFFDIVILDPPTFSNSKSMQSHWDVQQQHYNLITELGMNMTANGIIYFSTNATKFILDEQLNEHWLVKDITAATTDFDFVNKLRRFCFTLTKK